MFRIFSLFATSSKRSSLLSSSGLPMSVIRLVLKMSTGSLVRSMFPALIIYMKKLLDSDWLRAVQFKCNTGAKSVSPVQITHRNSGL